MESWARSIVARYATLAGLEVRRWVQVAAKVDVENPFRENGKGFLLGGWISERAR